MEIRRTLYLNKRDAPVSDQDPWFLQMEDKMEHWVVTCPKNDGGSGLSEKWYSLADPTYEGKSYANKPFSGSAAD